MLPKYATAKDVLNTLPISRTTLYRLIQKGVLPPPVKIGTRSFWKGPEIEEAINSLEAKRFN